MAIILSPGTRISDADGNPVAGSVRIYNANTTTPSNLYSDAALSVPLSNPVECNDAGYPTSNGSTPCGIFASTSNYDVAFLDAADAVLAEFEDVPAVGTDNSTFTRDFTNSRVQIRGSGGTIYLEAGDPSPDNTGGKLTIAGWAATQLDTLTMDAGDATVTGDLTVSGALTVGSTGLDNVLATGTATAQSQVDIPLTEDLLRYRLEIFELKLSTTASVYFRLAYDSTPTFKTAGSDYGYTVLATTAGLSSPTGATAAQIVPTGTNSFDSTFQGAILADILTPADTTGSFSTLVAGTLIFNANSGFGPYLQQFVGVGKQTYGRATYIRVLPSAGTISFKWRLVSGRGF